MALWTFWSFLPTLGKPLAIALLVLQVSYLFSASHEHQERIALKPTHEEFFSVDLFKDIENYIGRDKCDYRVVSVGIYTSIAAFNGFFTLDGYSSNYPLEYKKKFRKVIAGELQRSKFYRDYFDKWGSRYYVFSSELQALNTDVFLLAKESVLKYNAKIVELRFNTKVFKSMGGEYVFSTVRIENAEKINLELLRVLERDDSPCRIFVYQVKLLDQVNVHDQAKLADKYSALNEAYIL